MMAECGLDRPNPECTLARESREELLALRAECERLKATLFEEVVYLRDLVEEIVGHGAPLSAPLLLMKLNGIVHRHDPPAPKDAPAPLTVTPWYLTLSSAPSKRPEARR
jgi:hypothetical protein